MWARSEDNHQPGQEYSALYIVQSHLGVAYLPAAALQSSAMTRSKPLCVICLCRPSQFLRKCLRCYAYRRRVGVERPAIREHLMGAGVPLSVRFERRINKRKGLGPRGTCWEWTGKNANQGYGRIYFNGKRQLATHVAWFLRYNKFPVGCLCHTCDNPRCVRLSHLYEGTLLSNVQDRNRRGRQARGESIAASKLKEKEVRRIRQLFAEGTAYRKLGTQFNISLSVISRIVRHVSWRHVK